MQLLDPRNDFVFKKLFAQAPALLADLINAVRSSSPPMQVIEVINPTINAEELTSERIPLYARAQDAAGRRYSVHIQVEARTGWDPDWRPRSVFNLIRTLALEPIGEDDRTPPPGAISIQLLGSDQFLGEGERHQAVWCFELLECQRQREKLSDELELNVIELGKADRLVAEGQAQPGMNANLAAWVAFMQHGCDDARMAQIDHPPVNQALALLRTLSAEEETRRPAFMREQP